MAFNPNSSEKPVFQETKLYTGLANMKVVAVNPNKAELEAMGYKPQVDPVYLTQAEGNKKVRVDFYLSNKEHNIRSKIAIFLEDRFRVNNTKTKAEWMNNYGKNAWGSPDEAPQNYKWFDTKTARQAFVGEFDLHNFLNNWLNIAPTDEAKLDKFQALFNGDFSELKALVKANPDNEIRVLLTVREGKYQSVFNKYFDRATNKRVSYWESYIKKQTEEGYPPKEDFQNDFAFKVWVEPTVMADVAPVEADGKTDVDPF